MCVIVDFTQTPTGLFETVMIYLINDMVNFQLIYIDLEYVSNVLLVKIVHWLTYVRLRLTKIQVKKKTASQGARVSMN